MVFVAHCVCVVALLHKPAHIPTPCLSLQFQLVEQMKSGAYKEGYCVSFTSKAKEVLCSVNKEYLVRMGLQMGIELCPCKPFTSEYETVCTSQQCV